MKNFAKSKGKRIKTYGLDINKATTKVTLNGGTYDGIDASDANLNLSDMLGTDRYYTDSNGTSVFDGTSVTSTTEKLTVRTKRIDAVDVNITVPVVGAQPQPASSTPENTKVLSTVWSSDGAVIPETGTFEAGKTYKVQVSVYTKNDYFFGDPLTVTINGSTAVTDFERPGVGNRTITFEKEYTPGNSILNSVDVSITEPVAGAKPQEAATSNTANVSVSKTEWYHSGTEMSASDTFVVGETYKVHVIVNPDSGYEFADNPTATFNGSKTGTLYTNGKDYINYYAEFTAVNAPIDSVDVKITEPVAGAHPQDAVSNTDNVSVSITEWSHNGVKMSSSDSFVAGETYKVHVIVNPDSGYEFAENPTATFNGSKTGTLYTNGKDYINYYAEFTTTAESTEYAITVTNGKATVGAGTEISKAAEGTTVTLTANAASDGEMFDKWVVEDGSASITLADANSATTTFTMPAGAVSVKATYRTYITINLAAGEGSGTMEPLILKGTYGYYELIAPDCTFTPPANKVFDKWQFSKDDSYLKPGDTKTIWSSANGATLTAIWKDAPVTYYTVSFDSNGGTGTMADVTGISGEYRLPANGFTAPAGKQFKAWSVGGVEKAVGDKITVTANTTVTAVWEAVEYNVTVTGGTASVGAGTPITKATMGTTVTLTAGAAPTGQMFDKWVVNGVVVDDANSATTTFVMPAGNVTAEATYKNIPVVTYTVSFDANGGTGSMADATGVSGDYVLPVCGFTAPNGKQFKAWSVGGVEKAAGDTITVNANTTVTAIWENIPVTYYTVTFDSNGGSAVTAQSIEAGQKAIKPADPTKDGYDFKGWTLNGSAYDFNTAVNGNITLVATWEQQQVVPTTYTVSFDANGGTGSMAAATGVSGDYVLPVCGFTAPNGKQFKAWSVDGVEKAAGDKITVTANTTVTAVWEDIPAGHTCDIKPVAKVEPSCTEGGKEAYYKCEGCGKFYEDALGTKEITDLAAWGNLDKLGHTESDWKSDKAMFVCANRNIAYDLYKIIVELRPEWAVKKICADGAELTEKDKKELKPIEKVRMVMTRNKDDKPELYEMLGTKEDRKELDRQFKNIKSNFKIAIVVDMWLTGFDVPSLDTIYIDKPIQQHTLIQTISRVNRVYEGKDKGLIVDYIGIKKNMNMALKKYTNFETEEFEGVEQSITIVKDQLEVLGQMFHNFNSKDFFLGSPVEQLACLNRAVEYVQLTEELERRFMAAVKRMKQAFNLCSSSDKFTDDDKDHIAFYCAVRSILFKLTKGDAPDTAQMNARVRELLEGAIQSDGIEELFETGKHISVDIFSDEYMDKINAIQLPNTKIKILQRLLSQAIEEYKKVNRIMSLEFAERMKRVVDEYNNRRRDEAFANEVLDDVAEQLAQLLEELKKEKDSFKDMGIDYEEKAFYDILSIVARKYEFEYPDDKMIELSKRIKIIVDDKARYTDWSTRDDIKANLQVDLILLLDEFDYPPVTIDDVYKEVLEQAENFKKYAD